MNFIQDNLLSLIVFLPAVGALCLMLLPDDEKLLAKRLAFAISLVTLVLSVVLWFSYDASVLGFQFEKNVPWFDSINSNFHIGVDGLSVALILLTAILTPLAILASFDINDRTKMFMALFLILETGMMGLFVSLDMIIFFIFWEIGLVPMYFLIRLWGGADRNYASFKFFIYTMAGSLGLLLSIQVIGLSAGTFDILELYDQWVNLPQDKLIWANASIGTIKAVAYWAFVIAFAIKIPVWPFHTWLPDAHTQAPTAGSMILAGVLLKLGAYGFLRLVIPLFPEMAHQTAGILAVLGMLSIVLGAFAAYGQWDFKRLVAYSSINHMGFVVLGLAVYAYVYKNGGNSAYSSDAIMATNGVIMQMFNHGLSAAGMFFLVGVIYERAHTRDLKKFGGIWSVLPVYGSLLIFTSMASLGLPGLNGFIGEFAIVRGAWGVFPGILALSMIGLLMTGAYILKGIGETLHGPTKPEWVNLPSMTLREHLVIWPLVLLMLSIGLWPRWLMDIINLTVTQWFN